MILLVNKQRFQNLKTAFNFLLKKTFGEAKNSTSNSVPLS
jgi:hypothetical protein